MANAPVLTCERCLSDGCVTCECGYVCDRCHDMAVDENERLRDEIASLRADLTRTKRERDLLRAAAEGFMSVFPEQKQFEFWETFDAAREAGEDKGHDPRTCDDCQGHEEADRRNATNNEEKSK